MILQKHLMNAQPALTHAVRIPLAWIEQMGMIAYALMALKMLEIHYAWVSTQPISLFSDYMYAVTG